MKIFFHYISFIITIIYFSKCYADSLDESESFCSTDPDGSCSIPSKNNINNPFQGVQNLFTNIYMGYVNKINNITETKNRKRDEEFKIQEGSGIEKIDSSNYHLLTNGTWLVQIYSPWCPYSIHFQHIWKGVVKDVKTITEHMLSKDIPLEKEQKSIEKDNNKENEKKEDEELIIKKRNIMKNLRFAQIDAYESIDVAALLEVKGFPTIKILHKGNVVTYTNSTSHKRLVNFAIDDWMNQEWYNRLPKTPSKLYQLQLKFSLMLYKFMYYLDLNIYVPFKYITFLLFVYIAYSINILGKIRCGLIHVRQYLSAFVPEILDIE